jgi:WD40 repeat protein
VCPVTVAGRQLLASGGDDRTVRIWDPHTAASLLTVPTHYAALAVVQVGESLTIGLSAGILVIKPNVAR